MNFVAVDLGASSTRYAVGQTSGSGILPNNAFFVERINEDGTKVADMDPVSVGTINGEDILSRLEVLITKVGATSDFFPMHGLLGSMAESTSESNITPDVGKNKTKQRVNYLSLITTLAVARLEHSIDEKITLYLALPPSEVKKVRGSVDEMFVGTYEVTFPKYNGGTNVTVTIEKVMCHEESALAVTSFFFDTNGKPRDNLAKYGNKTILSIDIGASTIDLAITKEGVLLDRTGRTYKTGGNVAREKLCSMINEEYEYRVPAGVANLIMAEGRLQYGATYLEVGRMVNEAKLGVAKEVANYMKLYFSDIQIPIQTIHAIMVSGGGSMQSQYINSDNEVVVTSPPMSFFLTEELKDICPNIEIVSHSDNPRLANVTGLVIRARFDEYKMNKAAKGV